MNEITLNVEGARVTLPADTLTKLWLERVRGVSASARPPSYPKIGFAFEGQAGLYAGLMRGDDKFTADYHLVLLDGDHDVCTWADAKAWAEGLGGRLPTRREQSILFGNLKDQFQETWYWSSETHASYPEYAWYQYFDFGSQDFYRKDNELRARAVRRIDL